MRTLIAALLIAGAAWSTVDFAYWYSDWYGEYTQEYLERQCQYVDQWDIKIGSDPDNPNRFTVYYLGHINADMVNPNAKFYVDSLTEVLPTPDAMRAAGRNEEK